MGLSPETKALLDSGMSLADALKATCAKIPVLHFTGSADAAKNRSITFGHPAQQQQPNPFYAQMWAQEKAIMEECIKHASDANVAASQLSQEAQQMLKASSYSHLIHQWNEDIFMYMMNAGSNKKVSDSFCAQQNIQTSHLLLKTRSPAQQQRRKYLQISKFCLS